MQTGSTFVLRSPAEVAERVRIVSFFVTARLPAQDTRDACVRVLLEQLADLTGRELPATLPEATREAHLLGCLSTTLLPAPSRRSWGSRSHLRRPRKTLDGLEP